MLYSADVGNRDSVWKDAGGNELLTVAFRQVDVPLLLMPADRCHVEACVSKRFIDFVAHLKTVETDAGAYL
jgi:hypothetical protein